MKIDKRPIFDFLQKLQQNNSKAWMDENRGEYHHAKAIFVEVIDEIICQVKLVDPDFIPITAKKSVLRINQNLMYHPDRPPYKDYFGASIIKQEGKADFYLHVSPQECFIAGGFYHPSNEILGYIRQEVDYEADRFLSIINEDQFKEYFGELMQEDRLKTSPKGYSTDNHMIEYIRLKSFVVSHPISSNEFLNENYVEKAVSLYKTMMPFRRFLDQSLMEFREAQ
ncbi:DUF2461 domain-containing protein [Fulvivirga sp. RKSG066]|uniref:DUF2461 domain-containing protein n=1 Tax=Fulvivirga aurantia TaxID=2529383 RepID=UPI0012BC2119|nr:DUF2461 domain-containing protein [Fulvivirga aurantia]MTI22547.1 DUF2461 domain-containing protein [Fulvivirga aurantia]